MGVSVFPVYFSKKCFYIIPPTLLFFLSYMYICCIVARTTWRPVLWKYRDAVFLKHERAEAEADREAERYLWNDVGQ